MATDSAAEALSTESAAVVRQESAMQRLRRNWSVRIGGVVLLALIFIALAAPLLWGPAVESPSVSAGW